MIVKAKYNINDIIKGAIGISKEYKQIKITLKSLTDNRKDELIKLLGNRVNEFFDIFQLTHRVYLCPEGVKFSPINSIAVYDVKNLKDFDILERKSLNKSEKLKIKN